MTGPRARRRGARASAARDHDHGSCPRGGHRENRSGAGDRGNAEINVAATGDAPVDLGEFLLREADLEPFDFAEPAFTFGFCDAGEEVVTDLHEAVPLLGIRSQEGTPQAGVFNGSRGC